eukprot:Hpha_TRINITY_DN21504_c0_g1::TRINITY_DN21504_c0_g1_i1::g.46::m.46
MGRDGAAVADGWADRDTTFACTGHLDREAMFIQRANLVTVAPTRDGCMQVCAPRFKQITHSHRHNPSPHCPPGRKAAAKQGARPVKAPPGFARVVRVRYDVEAAGLVVPRSRRDQAASLRGNYRIDQLMKWDGVPVWRQDGSTGVLFFSPGTQRWTVGSSDSDLDVDTGVLRAVQQGRVDPNGWYELIE